ncbi:MAG: hypothetical protein E7587_04700 [Ruminococcaceae bacterium]|nr:hypothetical protein [Oscillospiraceae bacterium]
MCPSARQCTRRLRILPKTKSSLPDRGGVSALSFDELKRVCESIPSRDEDCANIEFGIPKEDAFRSASYTPACLLGYKKGKIEAGFDAEFVLADKDLNIIDTFIFD